LQGEPSEDTSNKSAKVVLGRGDDLRNVGILGCGFA
jgi:hypothetical protein